MRDNLSAADKFLRLALGFVVMLMGLGNQSWWGLLGLLPIATVLYRHCPVYSALGLGERE